MIMLLGNFKSNKQVQVKIDVVNTERVYVNTFLGVIIDQFNLLKTWLETCTVSKLSQSISVLCKAKHVLDHKSLYIIYCSLVLFSKLLYRL